MRTVLLIVALLFIAMLTYLTAVDISRFGLTPLDMISIIILVMFCTGIVGALIHRPPPE